MPYEDVRYEKEGRVAYVSLNRPEKRNALSENLRQELAAALGDAERDEEVRVVVVKGEGPAFCAGYDLSPAQSMVETEMTISQDRQRCRHLVHYWLDMWGYRKPIIAQVQGYCLAGGNELLAACDLVIASEDAQFGHPAGRAQGIPPTLGFWPVLIGLRKTKELLFTGDTIDAKEAHLLGLVNRVVPREKLEEEVNRLAERIANVPMDALTVHKHVTNRWFEIMGLMTAAYEGAEFDAIYHQTPSFTEFNRMVQEKGLREALAWRDAAFR
jgi:enoyl-CoA hydratase